MTSDASPPARRSDPNVDQRRASDPAASVWVAASAGSGKTKVLTDRILRLLLAGAAPGGLLAITFTKSAASEMQNRLAKELARWAIATETDVSKALDKLLGRQPTQNEIVEARRLFAKVLDTPGGMRIQTLHALCQSILARFPIEARIPPRFEVLEDRTAAELLRDARERVLAASLDGASDAPLTRALADIAEETTELGFEGVLRSLLRERARLAAAIAAAGGIDAYEGALADRLGVPSGLQDIDIVTDASADGAMDAETLRKVAAAMLQATKKEAERGEVLADWLALTAVVDRVRIWPDYGRVFLTDKGEIRKRLTIKAVDNACPGATEALLAEAERVLAVEKRRRAAAVSRRSAAMARLAATIIEGYQRAKARSAALDFDDLILATRRLLEREGIAPWVLFKLDGGIEHILVDEAQDTNPDQWAVVRALTDEFFAGDGLHASGGSQDGTDRTVFAVGDAKQSIYSFQRADPRAFEASRARFAGRAAVAGRPWDEVGLTVSFRSTAEVLAVVDATFNRAEAGSGVFDPAHGPLHHEAHRADARGRVEWWPATMPPDQDTDDWRPPVTQRLASTARQRLAGAIADRIRTWIDDGDVLPVTGLPIRAGDVMILLRSRDAFLGDLVRALKGRGIDVAGVDRMILTEELAVMDLLAVARFLLLPEDDLTLAVVLKGPFLDWDDHDLLDIARGRGKNSLWQALRASPGDKARTAAEWLAGLLAEVDFGRPFELFIRLLGEGGRRRLAERLGPEAIDPIDELLDQSLAYERTGTPSLEGFLHWVTASDEAVKRDLEEGTADKVRIMTVHGSKGLQAPVVFLPSSQNLPRDEDRVLWDSGSGGAGGLELPLWSTRKETDDDLLAGLKEDRRIRTEEEYRRLLYVAMTRAQDRLVVCGWADRRARSTSAHWHGLVRAGISEVGVPLDVPELVGLVGDEEPIGWVHGTGKPPEKPANDGKRTAESPPEVDLPAWATAPPPEEPRPPRPLSPSRPSEEPPARSPIDRDEGGTAMERGKAVHRLLRLLPDLPEAERSGAAHRLLSGQPGLSEAGRADLAREVLALLEDPALAPIFGPGSKAEVPIVGLVGEVAVSGRIDRLLITPDRVLVVDFKTNRPAATRLEDVPDAYLRQMSVYRALMRKLFPDRVVQCGIVWTARPAYMALPQAHLDPYDPDGSRAETALSSS